MDSTFQLIEQQVAAMEKGQVFFPDSFATLGSSQAVRSALTRMAKAGTITRIAQFEHDINLAPVWVRAMLEIWRRK